MTAAVERAAGGASPARAGRVMVVGSLNMDLVVRSARLPRPGETLAGRSFAQAAGGKGGNQAVAENTESNDLTTKQAGDPEKKQQKSTKKRAGVKQKDGNADQVDG